MSETPPPRRPLATFLRASPAAPTLVPTPVVPPAEPPEQTLPVPPSELPPAPAHEPVPPPVLPLVPTPGTAHLEARFDDRQHVPAPEADSTDPVGMPGVVSVAVSPPVALADVHAAAASPSAETSPSASLHGITPPAPMSVRAIHTAADASLADGLAASDAVLPGSQTAYTRAPVAAPLPLPAPAAPTFARRGLGRPRLRASGRQWAMLLGLAAALGLQIVIADRARLAGDARWRPLASAACAVMRCSLPAWREPAALTLLNRDVRPLHGMPGVLQIQASFRNDARWAQAWPWLQLSLSDADGRVIGTRVLAPQDYLGQVPPGQDTLAPGQAVQVAFAVREPAASTAAFSFDFR
ncbi:DUF3426 domain-containing protein [Xanthomonas melonis]|uniref:DUF3426 domain-containing protein n=1 Tax=Xanthomonas melonis TaxID=56456 RepID=A0A2S7DJC3_9XANT|nr:DUF3426 domain-containing protein [Xanthomonas melonis]MCC4599249.1 DUF3426 domain-containing protein [Xanthomonas melonis]PPU73928.1 hypothetical protein XmelCFBP4644_05620 [Xanthomonas melonis]